ncbi:MAG TPA: SDR family oxidoreductase [Thermoanaerobaculia bacterium]|jgi:NAD(P)-dependent dehydrogenase (short-subunit alcohol dehydrogenase family)|nr:SDR family oxidoreductase [Thermoanaerobaculia bacterium]
MAHTTEEVQQEKQTREEKPQIQSEPKPPYPGQKLEKPGIEAEMEQQPRWRAPRYKAAGKLEGKVALVTGGDSGIGRAVAYLYAREGADVAIVHLPEEQQDADVTRKAVEEEGRKCLSLAGDLTDPQFCRDVVERTARELGRLDILVSNAAWQNRKESIEDISEEEWSRTFRTNVDALFHLSKAAVGHMKPGSAIIVTSSETGLMGTKELLDYSSTKGAVNAFTKALAQQLVSKGIRVNAVAPGPVWTPLNPADQGAAPEKIKEFGKDQPIGRAAQPEEIAPAYVFLASDADSSYVTGIVLEEMGGLTTAG